MVSRNFNYFSIVKKILLCIPYYLEYDLVQESLEFLKLYESVKIEFGEDNEPIDKDSINNLALLDAKTNRSYGNAMFPIKRNTIIKNDMTGVFVPICTKNVFLKSYSTNLSEIMYWSDDDANDYLNAMKKVLFKYLPIKTV